MRSQLDEDFLEADLWEVEQTAEMIQKIARGEIDIKEVERKEQRIKARKEKEALLREMKKREEEEKINNGIKGKGEGKNYEKFCMNCFVEYLPKDKVKCTHCGKDLITRDERHKMLKEKVEILKEEKKKKKFRRMKYENFLKSQGMIHVDQSRLGPTNYTKWDMYESESDDENKEPILPKHDPQFRALEKQLNDDIKRREEEQRKCYRLKEEGNACLKGKKYKKAIKLYSDAIELCRGNMPLYTNRAFAYMKCEEWKNAMTDCDKVIEYYELFEEELEKHIDTYIKALTRKAFSAERVKDYDLAEEAIEKAIERRDTEEIKQLKETITKAHQLYKESLKALKIENDKNIPKIQKLIELLRKSSSKDEDKPVEGLETQLDEVIHIIKSIEPKLNLEREDNRYILCFDMSGGIDALFVFLNHPNNNNSNILTKVLTLINLISKNEKYKPLINNVKGYNKLIYFLFSTESKKEKKIAITIEQANIILTILESATLNEASRKTITDIGQLDNMVDIVLKKYEIAKITDVPTSNLLSKTFTFICNICYSSNEIRAKISEKVSSIIYEQLNAFIDNYNYEKEYQRNMLSSILSFITNLSCDIKFRKNLSKETKFLKFLSENILIELINNELNLHKNPEVIDEVYEKTASLFYNLTFIEGEETKLIKYYTSIKIEAFLFYYINHKFNAKKKDTYLPLLRSLMLLFRIVKYNPQIFDKDSNIPEKETVLDKLVTFFDTKYIAENPDIVEYNIKLWIFLVRNGNEILKSRMKKVVLSCNKILKDDCGNHGENITQKNMQRVVNMMSLHIAICGQFKEEANNMKEIVELMISICKEKTDLVRKNAAILLARIAKSSTEMEDYVRSLHGMDVLVNVSKFLNI